MTDEKMSTEEVPEKFTEWLLAMGCPADRVSSNEKVAERWCRGQYHLVWRSLMERVEARDVIANKRLQVFCDDIRKCQKKNAFSKSDSTVVPEQLSVWQQQQELKKKGEEAKARVALARREFDHLMDKISTKVAERDLSRKRVEDTARRAWLLRQVGAELQAKTANLQETRSIADALCSTGEDVDIPINLNKCISTFRRQNSQADANTTTNSVSSANGDNDFEDLIWQLTRCRGDALCSQLYERRAGLVKALAGPGGDSLHTTHNKVTPQSVLAHTAALHCTLILEATKNKVHLTQKRKQLIENFSPLQNLLSGESCELLVLRCEKSALEARVRSLQSSLEDITTGGGVFVVAGGEDRGGGRKTVAAVDKAIESKKEELKRVIAALTATEHKIQNTRECLSTVYGAFKKDGPPPCQYRGVQLNLPKESISKLRQYYQARRERRKLKVDLSLDLEVSDGSITDNIDYNNPRFVDELRIYLKKFNLDKNRQLVLESGKKIWIFETVEASVHRLLSEWVSSDLSCTLLCPSDALSDNIRRVVHAVQQRAELENKLGTLESKLGTLESHTIQDIDIASQKQEEAQITDTTKKRLREALLDLQKVAKSLESAQENLQFWTDNKIRKHISLARRVDGMTYKDYENYYTETCLNVCYR